jgi:hypothetical protein
MTNAIAAMRWVSSSVTTTGHDVNEGVASILHLEALLKSDKLGQALGSTLVVMAVTMGSQLRSSPLRT